eukprot:gene6060-11431_t
MGESSQTASVSVLKRFAKDNLVVQLEEFHGAKDLVIDEELLRPLDRFAGVSVLKQHGVEKIYKLEAKCADVGCERRMYVTRPYVSRMKMIVDHIKLDKEKKLNIDYRVVFTPKKLALCDHYFEEEGVYGDVKMEELPLDFIVLDDDVMSMEMPFFFRDLYLNGDLTWISTVARTIKTIQSTFGSIPKVTCFGTASKMVYDLLQVIMEDEREYIPIGGPEISSLVIFDRDVDCVTPLCSQLAYEGLLADVFGISSGYVDFGKDVTGSDKSTRVLLSSGDPVFQEIRDRHFTSVFPLLSNKAKQLQVGYNKRNDIQSVSDMKAFVSQDLKNLKQQHKSLSLHISACESILKRKTAEEFEKFLHMEQSILDDIEVKETFAFIEECINRQASQYNVLRLLCLLSQTRGTADVTRLKSLKLQYLQSYGYEHLLTFNNLSKVGIFNEGPEVPKNPASINVKNPTDMSYIFGGAYTPLSIKIIEQYICKGLNTVENLLKPEGISVFENRKPSSVRATKSHLQPSETAKKSVLVVFVGGCTHSEISALRFLGIKEGYHFMVLTTSITTGVSFVKSLLPP